MARQKLGKTSGKKRKKSAPRKARRGRRMGASGKLEPVLMNGAAVGAGIVAMRELSILAGTIAPTLMASPMLVGIAEIAAGGLAAWKGGGGFISYMGLGGMGNGIMTVLNGAGIIGAGPQTIQYPVVNRRVMGDPRLQFVAGPQTRIGAGMGSYPNNFSAVAGPGIGARKKRYTS
jgi:hypothetical protein